MLDLTLRRLLPTPKFRTFNIGWRHIFETPRFQVSIRFMFDLSFTLLDTFRLPVSLFFVSIIVCGPIGMSVKHVCRLFWASGILYWPTCCFNSSSQAVGTGPALQFCHPAITCLTNLKNSGPRGAREKVCVLLALFTLSVDF